MYKIIAIKDLPDCYHKTQLSKFSSTDEAEVTVVAIIGGTDADFAAYIGWPERKYLKDPSNEDQAYYAIRSQSIEWVGDYGDKLSEQAARAIFPQMSGFVYRD